MKRLLLLIVLCACIVIYYNHWAENNRVTDTDYTDTDTIVVDGVTYDYDDWVQMQWSVDSGYGNTGPMN